MSFISQTSLPGGSPDLLQSFTCDSTVYVGAWVYLDISGVVQNAIATSTSTSNIIGVVESKENITSCSVRLFGLTRDLYSGLIINTPYFLSPTVPGGITTTIPTDPGHVVARLGTPLTSSKFLVAPQMRLVRS